MVRFAGRLAVAILSLVLSASCAEPPSKEMNQAQGAIDAARVAAADRFASAEFSAAVVALARAEQSAAAGDYRAALSLAIDSRERAQNATKLAAEARANARGEAERAISEAATLVQRARTRLNEPAIAPLALRAARQTIDTAEKVLQEARTALKAEDYPAVKTALGGITVELQAALTVIDDAAAPASARRKR